MDNFLKKLARFSLKHPFWGKFEIYKSIVGALEIIAIASITQFVDFSSWSTRETSHFVGTVLTIAIILFITALILPHLVNGAKRDLPEVVIPQAHAIWYDNPQYRRIIDRLIRIATNDDDADLLRRWIIFFNQKKEAEERMASFEMQFLSKG